MKRFFTSRVWKVIFLAILAAMILAIGGSLTGKNGSGSLVQSLLTPFRAGASYLTDRAEHLYNYMFEYESLLAENQRLKEQLSQMEEDARRADSVSRENDRLRAMPKAISSPGAATIGPIPLPSTGVLMQTSHPACVPSPPTVSW